jgi:hypothetical protein
MDAVSVLAETVETCRARAADDPVHLVDLATALSELGIAYHESGRQAEAVERTEEALAVWRRSASDDTAHGPALVGTLSNLGIFYALSGRLADSIGPS